MGVKRIIALASTLAALAGAALLVRPAGADAEDKRVREATHKTIVDPDLPPLLAPLGPGPVSVLFATTDPVQGQGATLVPLVARGGATRSDMFTLADGERIHDGATVERGILAPASDDAVTIYYARADGPVETVTLDDGEGVIVGDPNTLLAMHRTECKCNCSVAGGQSEEITVACEDCTSGDCAEFNSVACVTTGMELGVAEDCKPRIVPLRIVPIR